MNQKTTLVLLALAVITIIALICGLLVGRGANGDDPSSPLHCPLGAPSTQTWPHPDRSQLFADLSPDELTAVMSFLRQQLGPGLVDAAQAQPSDNCVFSVELQLPRKAVALAHLDRGGPPPAREALAIVFFGAQAQPNVSELVVGPLPQPSYVRDVTVERHGGPLPYHRRPVLAREYLEIDNMLFDRELPRAAGLLHHCCFYTSGGRNLILLTVAPRGLQSGDRATWFGLYYNISGAGFYLNPVGLELLVNHKALNPAHWHIQKVFYQGRYYESLAQLEEQFEAGMVNVVLIPNNGTGLKNYVWADDMAFVPSPVPWNPEHQMQKLQVTRKLLATEDQAAFPLGGGTPRYVYLASNHSNKWGHPRGYRIQILSFSGEPLPRDSLLERAFSWGRYQLAVTQQKDKEPRSSSVFNQNDPWTPTVDFAKFINNETIAGEDLVAWVTAGFLHIPHAEDIPNTVTVANGVGFFLRPYNFFDEDPSFYSADSVYFQEDQDAEACAVNPLACLPQVAACAPELPAFTHGGFTHN
ncbi:membrane primary amine oxidase-like isoform X2 [Ochotona princeps]|uniref:membrane primary amine oxidase-like isoform X2 n=1 Tax=Ochotona princeps TaxID=9978 RepID=UPI002714981D|nr:membrane primary amine oxidase-like isoform X2 [Ochotona princeps]